MNTEDKSIKIQLDESFKIQLITDYPEFNQYTKEEIFQMVKEMKRSAGRDWPLFANSDSELRIIRIYQYHKCMDLYEKKHKLEKLCCCLIL